MAVSVVCTLGSQPLVLTETLDLLLERGEHVTKMLIFHTADKSVVRSMKACKQFLKETRKIRVKLESLSQNDIFTQQDSNELLTKMIEAIDLEVRAGKEVIISIAGGRKTMTAVGFLAACLRGVKAVFHVVTREGVDERTLFEQHGYNVPTNKIRLIQVPHVRLDAVVDQLRPLPAKASLIPDYVGNLSDRIREDARFRRLHEGFHEIIGTYEMFSHAVKTILEHRMKAAGIKFDVVHCRSKKFESFIEKAGKLDQEGNLKYPNPFLDIEDLAGVRPVLFYKSDLQKLKEIIYSEFAVIFFEPKAPDVKSVYESDHYVVALKRGRLRMPEFTDFKIKDGAESVPLKCEIQTRTIFDHAWAQFEHQIVYKGKKDRKEILYDKVYRRLKAFLDESKDIVDQIKAQVDRGEL